jgi:soluble lytic murein transglycosylase
MTGAPATAPAAFWAVLWTAFLAALWAAAAPAAAAPLGFEPDEQIRTAPDGSPLAGAPLPGAETGGNTPYWVAPRPEPQTPYWLQGPAAADPAAPAAPAEGLFAPPPPPPPPPTPEPARPAAAQRPAAELPEPALGERRGELSYYMFKDDQGVIHLTDAPSDPRYRLFSIQITVSSGLAPFRRLDIERIRPMIMAASTAYKVDPALIAAIIRAESAFDPRAVSWAGARGLMQLMPSTARLVGCLDSFDPEQNIMGGTKYLRMMLNRFEGDVVLAVSAYNAGPERVARVMAVPEISETKNYVKVVLRNYEMFLSVF